MDTETDNKDVENKNNSNKKSRPLRIKFIRYGAIAGILGTLFAALQPWAMEKAISSQIKIDPSSPGYMFWQRVPLPIITKFNLFNIENPDEFLKGGKLRVREVGPFVLAQERWKEVIEFNDKTVKYYEWRNYTILYEQSNGSWDQEITVLNPLVASIGSSVGDKLEQLIPVPLAVSPFVYSTVSALLLVHSQNFFLKTTPRNLIIGQRVNLLDTVTTLIKPLELLGVKASDLIPTEDLPNNTFGLINGKNYTRMGPWEVFTGIDVPKEMYAAVIGFKNERLMKRWAGPACNTPRGTDGIQFQPLINRTNKLTVFAADIYRSLDLTYLEDTDYFGIPVYKYVIGPEVFQPPSVNPDNACYCVHKGKKKARCEHYGILDCTGGFSGSPFIVTRPHFLDAEPEIQRQVDGLSPDPEKHTFYLLVKPDLGVPISAKGRLQFNLRVERVPFLRGFSNIRDTIVPLGWIEEGGDLDGALYYLLKGGLIVAPVVASAGFYSAAIGGWAAFIGGLIYLVARKSGRGKVGNVDKLFEPRVSPTKEELIKDSDKLGKISINQSQQSALNGVLVPVDYNQSPGIMNNALALVNGSSYVPSRATGPISIIPLNTQDMYTPSPVIQFYQLPSQMTQNGQFDQLVLTIPNTNVDASRGNGGVGGTVPKIMWTERQSKSVKERTVKDQEKMTRGRSLPPRAKASQRSKRIQVTSKETQDRFVQVDRDINGFRYAGKNDIIKSYTASQRNNLIDHEINVDQIRKSGQSSKSFKREANETKIENTYENIAENKNLSDQENAFKTGNGLKDQNGVNVIIEKETEKEREALEDQERGEGFYDEVPSESAANGEVENLYDTNNRSQSPKTEPILQNVSANLFASSSHISRSLIDMVISGNQTPDTENDNSNKFFVEQTNINVNHDQNVDDDGIYNEINKQARPSLGDVVARSISAKLPGAWASGSKNNEENRLGTPISQSGLRSTYSAVSRYQSINPREPDDDKGDETTLFERNSTTESETVTPQSGYDTMDEKQEVKPYQTEGINNLPGIETPERLGTPSFSDEFSIGSNASRTSSAKSLLQPKDNNKQQESKTKSSCSVS